jgi:phytol kinase
MASSFQGSISAGIVINHDPPIRIGCLKKDRRQSSFQMREFFRKLVHIIFGLGIAALVQFTPKSIALPLLMTGTFAGFILTDALVRGYRVPLLSNLIDMLERENVRPGKGALYFALSSLFCLMIFEKEVVVPAIVALALLDGVATIVGIYYGKHPIVRGKTAEGTGSGILLTFVALLPLLPPPEAAVSSVVAGLVELLSPVDDNLTIPVFVCIALTLMGGL